MPILQVVASPNPFPVNGQFVVRPMNGTSPYTFTAAESPPNPPGVTVVSQGAFAVVTVPVDTPPGTVVSVDVSDSGNPVRTGTGSSVTAGL